MFSHGEWMIYPPDVEYLRETCGPSLSDEQLSDGHEYLAFLKIRIQRYINRTDWSFLSAFADKIKAIERILHDDA